VAVFVSYALFGGAPQLMESPARRAVGMSIAVMSADEWKFSLVYDSTEETINASF
jgi:hypothetical protein